MKFRIVPMSRASGRQVLLADEMRAADERAIELGVAGLCLMENAGRHVARVVAETTDAPGQVILMCGAGNNGGDGFVAARHLQSWGYAPEIWLARSPGGPNCDAGVNLAAARATGVLVREAGSWQPSELSSERPLALVDALLGTGLKGAVRPGMNAAILEMNRVTCPVIAVDIPSGLCADLGCAHGNVVQADVTVTFHSSKMGHWLYPGSQWCGRMEIVDIGMPDRAMPTGVPDRRIIMEDVLTRLFTRRPLQSHKGTYGHLGVVGGGLGRTGSVHMAADAAMASGAGLVTIGTEADAVSSIATDAYEVMVSALIDDSLPDAETLVALGRFDALVVGPGFPTDAAIGQRLLKLLAHTHQPIVLDADALNHAAGSPGRLKGPGARVLTPHPGEAARLLGMSAKEVQAGRKGAALELARAADAVVVLKGAHTLIATACGRVQICPYGNPGMATAGMGDVLAGVIGAMLARGLDPVDAASAGVVWHAMAGDHAVGSRGENGLRARDVIECLAEVERCCRD